MSQIIDELRSAGNRLKAYGADASASVCFRAADRMERMEKLIVEIREDIEASAKEDRK